MDNPLLEFGPLPAFDRIKAAHARPALELILGENRTLLATLTSQAAPTFRSLVVPVEEMSYRLSRVWSPIAHLNAVANTAELRAAYNECIPLLTAYSSELGQNAALKAGYEFVRAHEGDSLAPESRRVIANALRDFRLAGVDLQEGPKARFRELQQQLAQLATKFAENVLDSAAAFTRTVSSEPELAGLPPNTVARAAADARQAGQPGWLFKLDQPTYLTVMTCAEDTQLRRDIYCAWVTRASDQGPSANRFDNTPLIEEILRLRARARHPDGEEHWPGAQIPGRTGRAVQSGGPAGICRP
jgi:oligopeptidase A